MQNYEYCWGAPFCRLRATACIRQLVLTTYAIAGPAYTTSYGTFHVLEWYLSRMFFDYFNRKCGSFGRGLQIHIRPLHLSLNLSSFFILLKSSSGMYVQRIYSKLPSPYYFKSTYPVTVSASTQKVSFGRFPIQVAYTAAEI